MNDFGGFRGYGESGRAEDKVKAPKRYKVVDYTLNKEEITPEDDLYQVYRRQGLEEEYKFLGLYSKKSIDELENTLCHVRKKELEEASGGMKLMMSAFTDNTDEKGESYKANYLFAPFTGFGISLNPVMEEK